MQIELSERARELVERCLAMGYESPEAVVEQALLRLEQLDVADLRALLAEGIESAEGGNWIPADAAMARARAIVDDARRREVERAV